MFDSSPISVVFCLKTEHGVVQYSSEIFRFINRKNGEFDIMFLQEFSEKYLGESG